MVCDDNGTVRFGQTLDGRREGWGASAAATVDDAGGRINSIVIWGCSIHSAVY